MKKPTCQVCNKHVSVGVACVPGVPMSVAYCRKCLSANAHPYGILVTSVAINNGLKNTCPEFRLMVFDTLVYLNKTINQFQCDVKKEIDSQH